MKDQSNMKENATHIRLIRDDNGKPVEVEYCQTLWGNIFPLSMIPIPVIGDWPEGDIFPIEEVKEEWWYRDAIGRESIMKNADRWTHQPSKEILDFYEGRFHKKLRYKTQHERSLEIASSMPKEIIDEIIDKVEKNISNEEDRPGQTFNPME